MFQVQMYANIWNIRKKITEKILYPATDITTIIDIDPI